jgi:hypothetical protein
LSFGQICNKILKIKNDVLFNVLNEIIYLFIFFWHNKLGGFVVKKLISLLGVQKSPFTNDMGCDQCWNVDQIFPAYVNGNIIME